MGSASLICGSNSSNCVNTSRICDGTVDCASGMDEDVTLCG